MAAIEPATSPASPAPILPDDLRAVSSSTTDPVTSIPAFTPQQTFSPLTASAGPSTARIHAAAPPTSWAYPHFREIVDAARRFYTGLQSYPSMFVGGYNTVYGPLLDVAPADPLTRGRSTMWKLGRIHTWRREVAELAGKLTVHASENRGGTGFFVLKHAPGYGRHEGALETSNQLPVDRRSLEEITADFAPFRNTLTDLGPSTVGIMVSGAVVPSLQPEGGTESPSPVVLSPNGVRWIRQNLGPYGEDAVLITDDMNADIFWPYYKRQCGLRPDQPLMESQRWEFMIRRLAEADVDIMLNYETPPEPRLQKYLKVGEELVERGVVDRARLERSVLRILRVKQRLYPNHPRLQDLEETVRGMSVRELLAQKLILPAAWEGSTTAERIQQTEAAVRLGIGGISLEGTERLVGLLRGPLQSLAREGFIPPLVSNNSPQELGGFDNKGNDAYRHETEPIPTLTTLMDQYYPEGAPKGLINAVLADVLP